MLEIIKTLRNGDWFGGGECIEIAKGKYEIVTDFKGLKRKAKRLWLSKR